MKIPTTLKHKPVIIVEEYEKLDGPSAYKTDAKGLSLGLAQWNDRGNVNISAKVWRHTGDKWSRQSEELPLHRVLDLAILICSGKHHFQTSYRQPHLFDEKNPRIEQIPLQGGEMDVEICMENERIEEDIKLFAYALSKDEKLLDDRLKKLAKLLTDMGYME